MSRRLVRNDEGFTMLVVMASMLLVLGLVLAGLTFAITAVKNGRASQDTKSALSAAQAGIADYVARLNSCDTYWVNQCPETAEPNPAIGGWATLPGTAGSSTAQYQQTVVANPLTTGFLRLQVVGRIQAGTKTVDSRTLTVDLGKNGFLKYLYYTTYETRSPADQALTQAKNGTVASPSSGVMGSSVTYKFTGDPAGSTQTVTLQKNNSYTLLVPTEDQVKRGCERPIYDAAGNAGSNRSTFPRTLRNTLTGVSTEIWPDFTDTIPSEWSNNPGRGSPYYTGANSAYFDCTLIQFGNGDTFDGPVHTQDAFYIPGAQSVTFAQPVTTNFPGSGVGAAKKYYWGSGSTTTGSNQPKGPTSIQIPSTNTDTLTAAQAGGCVYSGPTEVVFLDTGKVKVRSPNTRSQDVRAGCTTGAGATTMSSFQVIDRPSNGVFYVKNLTGPSAGTCIADYQSVAGDQSSYDNSNCTAGDAFVSGSVNGRFTVSSAHNVLVVDDTVYKSKLAGTDVLGLIAQKNVSIWHPVSAGRVELADVTNREVDAAIAAVAGSFSVLNYDIGSPLGNLTVKGVIVQKFRGTVATGGGGTGYSKKYSWDARLPTLPPPFFLAPENDPWSVTTLSEQQSP
ncbi:hypothetical protein [Kineococcus sp. R86509]|uniref:hypothetical protein n=1 Tax=Kineococcus sp. R86509 TaxID=3093851 RepID=UPI0036D3C55F